MTNDVLLSIRGMQFAMDAEDDNEEIETLNRARYYKKLNAHYLIYDEHMEGFEEPTKNRIKILPGELVLTRKGVLNVEMHFEEGKKHLTSYRTPFGELLIGIETDTIKIKETANEIAVSVSYSLEVNYEHLSDSQLEIRMKAIT